WTSTATAARPAGRRAVTAWSRCCSGRPRRASTSTRPNAGRSRRWPTAASSRRCGWSPSPHPAGVAHTWP
ncbi:MAG: hypothetical protein AVDCRST_MAG41-2914, partial [uncultured Corynebacteriales bacterium]